MLKIMLTGKMRSGKTTVAHQLSIDYGLRHLSFGKALKTYAEVLFDGSQEYPVELYIDPNDPFLEEQIRKPRKLYQDFGQALRELDPDVWIRQVENTIKLLDDFKSTKGYVIDDCRQLNELEWGRENGFAIIRIVADEETRIKRMKALHDSYNEKDLAHTTETALDEFEADYTIYNDGNLTDLMKQVRHVLDLITNKQNGKRENNGE